MSGVILDWSGVLPTADRELTDDEILEQFGPLMRGAVSAFREDPNYLVEMSTAAAALKKKRSRRAS